MPLSVVDLYAKILPKTNCKECGYLTCIAFAGMVVSEKHPLKNCPHIDADILKAAQIELEQQYKEGKWLKKDMAKMLKPDMNRLILPTVLLCFPK